MNLPRASGILLHPSSLPSRGGIGDFGPEAYNFVDFLTNARQKVWQILPLGPVGDNSSPYSAASAFAGNPLLISLDRLAEQDWIERASLLHLPDEKSTVDFKRVAALKTPLLRQAAKNFIQHAPQTLKDSFDQFRAEQSWWLDDFVLFNALHQQYHQVSWNHWPHALAQREPSALVKARAEFADELAIGRVIQFAFFEQWKSLRAYCAERGIAIMGDVAIFVNHDSADVWTHPQLFHLKQDMSPSLVSGVPPDVFSATGQRWGNPLYRWDILKASGFEWWIQRMRGALQLCDLIRLDHFIGFTRYWEISAEQPDAVHGRWVPGPKDALFDALQNALGQLPFVAEDLGAITDEVIALRDRLGLPGMRILEFGFGDRAAHFNLPQNFERNCVVYTGTHDNDTVAGWWHSATAAEREEALACFGRDSEGIHWAFIRAAAASVANLCVFPLQDVLGLGSEARMNYPARSEGNWHWRYSPDALTSKLTKRLAVLTEVTDRA